MDDTIKDRVFAGMVAASTAVAGAYIYKGLKTPEPGQDQEVASGLTVERHDLVGVAHPSTASMRGRPSGPNEKPGLWAISHSTSVSRITVSTAFRKITYEYMVGAKLLYPISCCMGAR